MGVDRESPRELFARPVRKSFDSTSSHSLERAGLDHRWDTRREELYKGAEKDVPLEGVDPPRNGATGDCHTSIPPYNCNPCRSRPVALCPRMEPCSSNLLGLVKMSDAAF